MSFALAGTAIATAAGASATTAALVGAGSAFVGSQLMGDDSGAAAANQSATDANNLQARISAEQWAKYLELYEPLERQMVDEAQDYASPENYAKAAGEASAAVSQQFSKARDRLTRTPGLDPSSGAYQSSLVGLDLAQAANDATQQNLARKNVTDMAYARKTDALSLGKGLPANATVGLANAAKTSTYLADQQIGLANSRATQTGALVGNVFNAAQKAGWLNNGASGGNLGLSGVQAGSSSGNGSVQGNSDYIYDL